MNQIVGFIIPLIIMFALMYFMIIRPQQKQMKKAQDMYDQLENVSSENLKLEIVKQKIVFVE